MVQAVDWSAVGAASTAVGVLVALAAVVTTLIFTLRSERLTRAGQDLQRGQADAAAARSEAAAALTEEYTQRVVLALETMAEHGLGAAAPAKRGVQWSLTHHDGDTYLLRNDGDERAQDITVSAHESMLTRLEGLPDILDAGEGFTFIAARSMGTRDSTITVIWRDNEDGGARTWRYPLPPRRT